MSNPLPATIYDDPRAYDLLFGAYAGGQDDLEFYLRQAQAAGLPVLELGCGTGRLTIPLAERGVDVTGLDISPMMLSLAQAKASTRQVSVRWVEGDCRDFDLGHQFGLIFIPANSLVHLTSRASAEACFACVREHLTPGGRFVIDLYNPSLPMLLRGSAERHPIGQYPDPDGRGEVVVTESNAYDTAAQISRSRWFYRIEGRSEEHIAELAMRVYFPQELDALLHYNGFRIEAKYGSFDEMPFTASSRKQLIVCTATSS